MKTRNIQTRFWRDSYISSLNSIEKLAFLYFLTNEQVNLCGIYELPDKYVQVDLGIKDDELEKIKKRFTNDKKIFFYNGWVYILNYHKYNKFNPLPNIARRFKEEFNNVPAEIKKHFFAVYDYNFPLNIEKEKIKYDKDTVTVIDIDIVIDNRLGGRLEGRLQNKELEEVNIEEVIKDLKREKGI